MSIPLDTHFDYYPANYFMPREPDEPLSKNEEGFLKIYSSFAAGMDTLFFSRNNTEYLNSPDARVKILEVIRNSLESLRHLKENPLDDLQQNKNMIEFLKVTSESLKRGKWMGNDFLLSLEKQKEVENKFQKLHLKLPKYRTVKKMHTAPQVNLSALKIALTV